jgi:hypothetical protein
MLMTHMRLFHIAHFNVMFSSLVFNHVFRTPSHVCRFLETCWVKVCGLIFSDTTKDDGMSRAIITVTLKDVVKSTAETFEDVEKFTKDTAKVTLSSDATGYAENECIMSKGAFRLRTTSYDVVLIYHIDFNLSIHIAHDVARRRTTNYVRRNMLITC